MTSADTIAPEAAPASLLDDPLYEIIDDQRVQLPPMGAYGTWIASFLIVKIGQFPEAQGWGRAVTEMLFRISSNPNVHRRPDAAFVSFERWPRGRRPPSTNAWDVVPDLVVEVVSPSNLAEEFPTRVREFFAAGVRRAWIVYPHESLVYDYDSPRSIRVLGLEGAIDGGAILPGFRLALADLFEGTEDSEPA